MKILLSVTKTSPYAHDASGDALATTNAAVLGQLFHISENFQLEPGQIDRWFWEEKDQSYHLRMKAGMKFHSGRVANSKDLEFSLVRGFFSKQQSFYKVYVGNIEGVDAIKPGQPYKSGLISGIKILNDLEISIKLKHHNPAFLFSLVNPFLAIVPMEEFEPDLLTWKRYPIGLGAFKVAKPFDGHCLEVVRIGSSKDGLNQVTLCTDLKKDTKYDILFRLPEGLDESQYEKWYSRYPSDTAGLFPSFLHPLAKDYNFRMAVYHAINRTTLVDGQTDAVKAFELLPSHTWGRAGIKDPYDLAKAKEYLSKLDPKLLVKPISGSAYGGTILPANRILLDRITNDLAKIGVQIQWEPTLEKFGYKEGAQKYALWFRGRVSDHVDPLLMFGSFRNGSAYEFFRPQEGDPKYEQLYQAASAANQKEDRVKTLQALSAYVNEFGYFIPLAERKMVYWVRKGAIKDLGRQTQSLILALDQIQVR